ncbi:NucA/NucB deoxyribonuclease domain-containing protein [Streptomyces sp. NBC_01549]|uniref:NucA/NucB deoxyribonuclease domain-containing protein n=1 Tax=unclassified Streptomyces TaxID=2593676 RepID=UPI00338FE0AE
MRAANRNAARDACKSTWPGYSLFGKDCDEYPFSSTAEGASVGDFSARAGQERQSEGGVAALLVVQR